MIVIIAALAFLALISLLMVSLNRQEYNIASNVFHNLRAQYTAEAGLNYAVASLREEACSNSVDTYAEDWSQMPAYENILLSGNIKYEVKEIIDLNRLIYLNDDNTNARLENMINNLGLIIGSACDGDEGTKILSQRPAAGYIQKDQINAALDNGEYQAIKDFLSVYSYVDNTVIDPQDAASAYAFLPRAPINVNTAAKETLKAVLYNIEADGVCPRCGGDGRIYSGTSAGAQCPACSGSGDLLITLNEADALADYIIANRPYKTWSEFYNSILSCADIGPADADLVMANANPNTGINAHLRNYGWGQKAGRLSKAVSPLDSSRGLTRNTTEFCFNSGGYYQITVVGFSYDASGGIVAQKKIQAVVKIFDIWKQTTQSDFQGGTLSNLISLPEPVAAGIQAADYDGQLSLAAHSQSSDAHTLLLANFDDSLDLDHKAAADMQLDPVANTCQVNSIADALDPGSLLPEGVFLSKYRNDALVYWEAFNGSYNMGYMDKGTISIWLKVVSGGKVYHSAATLSGYDLTCSEAPVADYTKPEFSIFDMYSGHYVPGHASPWHGWKDGYTDRAELWFFNDWDTIYPDGSWPIGFAGLQEVGNNINPGASHPADPDASQIVTKGNARREWAPGSWHRIVYTYELDAPSPANPDPLTGVKTLYLDSAEPELYVKEEYHKFNGNIYKISFGAGEHTPSAYIIDEIKVDHECWDASKVQSDYASGRYYDNSDAYFISSSQNLPNAHLGTIYWTQYMPNEIAGGEIQFDVYDGASWLGSYAGRKNPEGCSLNVDTSGSGNVQYKAYFINSNLGLYDTPILDDVNITYLENSKILSWRYLK